MQAKVVEARIGCAVRASFCGISRILFPLSRDGDHLSHPVSRAPSSTQHHFQPGRVPRWGLTRDLKVVLDGAGCDYYPRVSSRIRGKSGQATLPLLRLAPHGVFRAAPLTRMPGGLLPRLFTLTPLHFQVFLQNSIRSLAKPESGAGRYIFCDTVRHPGFTSWAPPISRGMLPSGVRTFLWQNKYQASDHPPQERVTQSEVECEFEFRSGRAPARTAVGRPIETSGAAPLIV